MQAARGTSVDRPGAADLGSAAPASPRRARLLLVAVLVFMYSVDQLTKALAVARLTGEPERPLIGQVLQLRLVRNPGAAFSAGTAYTGVLACVAIGAALVVAWLSMRVRSQVWAFAFGLLLAGILGNLTDRLLREPGPLRGHVVDFLMLPHWPVFNVADMCINVAAGLILVQAFRGVRLDGSRTSSE